MANYITCMTCKNLDPSELIDGKWYCEFLGLWIEPQAARDCPYYCGPKIPPNAAD